MCLILSGGIGAAQKGGTAAQAEADDIHRAKLIECVRGGDADCVAQALAEGADADAADENGVAALILAAEGKSARVVRLLLEAGAEVNVTNEDERTALDAAESWGTSSAEHRAVIELLRARGATSGKQKSREP